MALSSASQSLNRPRQRGKSIFSEVATSPTASTDWDRYYTNVPATAKLTRKYSAAVLGDAIRKHAAPLNQELSIVEIGGANSCFIDSILRSVRCSSYHVIDTNAYGLSLLQKRIGPSPVLRLHQQSVLGISLQVQADLVYSVGLVEHFDPAETRKAILAHFDLLRIGGTAIINFPTPTLLYRCTRKLIEALGMWGFPDERPLRRSEVLSAIAERGEVLEQKTLWPLMLTQHMIVARKIR